MSDISCNNTNQTDEPGSYQQFICSYEWAKQEEFLHGKNANYFLKPMAEPVRPEQAQTRPEHLFFMIFEIL